MEYELIYDPPNFGWSFLQFIDLTEHEFIYIDIQENDIDVGVLDLRIW